MDELKAKSYFVKKGKYFMKSDTVDEALMNAVLATPDSHIPTLMDLPFKSPIKTLGYAIFLGFLGWDQSYLYERKKMLIKLFTLGGLGILWVKDAMSALDRCREFNYKLLMNSTKDIKYAERVIKASKAEKSALSKLLKAIFKGGKNIGKTFKP